MRQQILAELRCRKNSSLHIAALVDDYGIEVKDELQRMRRDGLVRLVAAGSLAMAAEEYGEEVEAYKAKCIEQPGEWMVSVEMR